MPFCDFARDFTEAAHDYAQARERAEKQIKSRQGFKKVIR